MSSTHSSPTTTTAYPPQDDIWRSLAMRGAGGGVTSSSTERMKGRRGGESLNPQESFTSSSLAKNALPSSSSFSLTRQATLPAVSIHITPAEPSSPHLSEPPPPVPSDPTSLLPFYAVVTTTSAAATKPTKPKQKTRPVRTRIRTRITREGEKERDWREELMQEMYFGEKNEPLITPEEIEEIRRTAWTPTGVFIPHLCDLTMGYDSAWDIGKKGSVALKLNGDFDLRIGPNKLRFFLMDGTNPDEFLTYYTKPDVLVEKGEISEKKGSICASDLREGFWNYRKKKVRIAKVDLLRGSTSVRVLEEFPSHFFDAMLVCIREMEVCRKTKELKARRIEERWYRDYQIMMELKSSGFGSRSLRPSISMSPPSSRSHSQVAFTFNSGSSDPSSGSGGSVSAIKPCVATFVPSPATVTGVHSVENVAQELMRPRCRRCPYPLIAPDGARLHDAERKLLGER